MKVYFELSLHFTGLFADSFSLQQNQRIFNEFEHLTLFRCWFYFNIHIDILLALVVLPVYQ